MEKKTQNTKNTQNTAVKPVEVVRRKQLSGVVVSDKMKDTIVVSVDRFVKSGKYQKFMNLRKRYKVHDAGNTKKIGDKVTIESCRPISRHKSFRVIA